MVNKLKSPVKWAGGKRWIIQHLKPLYQDDRRLIEPFCGGMSVSLGLVPERAFLNDINPHVINFFQHIKKGLVIDFDMRNDKEMYYHYRDQFNELIIGGKENTAQAAGLFYYLNRTGFNGLCRFNKSGLFNVPFGSYKSITYREDFMEYMAIMSGWKFVCGDFMGMKLESEDFIYADPPYDVQFTTYSKEGFKWDDQIRLAEWLSRHRGPVVASNQATDRVIDLYKSKGFDIEFLDAPRMISCTGDRSKAKEILATKNIQGEAV